MPSRLAGKICTLCGHAWTPENLAAEEFQKHMVEVHGFKREGGQVFRSIPCVACPKIALYKVSSVGYCREHLQLAKDRHVARAKLFAERAKGFEKVRKLRDDLALRAESLKRGRNVRKNYK